MTRCPPADEEQRDRQSKPQEVRVDESRNLWNPAFIVQGAAVKRCSGRTDKEAAKSAQVQQAAHTHAKRAVSMPSDEVQGDHRHA